MHGVAADRANGRPTLLVCGFDGGDGTVAEAVRRVVDEGCGLVRGALRGLALPPDRREAVEALFETVLGSAAAGVLLVDARPKAGAFEVLMRAENAVPGRGRARISPIGPGVARATAPVAAMVRAIEAEGLPVRASSDAGDDVANYALYRLLTEFDDAPRAPGVGALFAPGRLGDEGPITTLSTLEAGLRAAIAAFANALPTVRAYA